MRDRHHPVEEDDPEADELAQALQDSSFIDVVHAMTRLDPGPAPEHQPLTNRGQRPFGALGP